MMATLMERRSAAQVLQAPRGRLLLAFERLAILTFDPQNWEDELYRLITSGRTPSGGLGQLWLSITQSS